nr:hypothetical protein CFP56_18143 [Quercus suber]
MSLKNMIRKLMNELGEAIEEVNFAQLKLKKAEQNAKRLFKKLKDMKVLPISDMEEAQYFDLSCDTCGNENVSNESSYIYLLLRPDQFFCRFLNFKEEEIIKLWVFLM